MNTNNSSPLEYSDFAGGVYRYSEANEMLRKEWDKRHAGELWTFKEEAEYRRIHNIYEGKKFVKLGKCLGRTPRAVIIRAADHLGLITEGQKKKTVLEVLSQTPAMPAPNACQGELCTPDCSPVSTSNDLNKWTLDDEAYLVDAMRAGSSIADICARLQRSDNAVVDHLEAMGPSRLLRWPSGFSGASVSLNQPTPHLAHRGLSSLGLRRRTKT